MPDTNDKCPYCGSTPIYRHNEFVRWDCGTVSGVGSRKHECYERQIAALQAQVAELKELLATIRWSEHAVLSGFWCCWCGGHEDVCDCRLAKALKEE